MDLLEAVVAVVLEDWPPTSLGIVPDAESCLLLRLRNSRHSIAVHALEEGFGLEYVADLLGHTSVRSTAIYARITSRGREDMMRRLDRNRHAVSW